MNSRARTSHQPMKYSSSPQKINKKMMERQGSCLSDSERSPSSKTTRSSRDKKMALLQDVDKLKKKLKHEENIHRALERAFNRPLGVLPRLPPYLPPDTQELLAEIAVLEEEVVRLEEQVVDYRQGLYQEAIYISSKAKMDYSQFDESGNNMQQARSREDNGVNLATLMEVSPRSFVKFSRAPSADVFDHRDEEVSASSEGAAGAAINWRLSMKDRQYPVRRLFAAAKNSFPIPMSLTPKWQAGSRAGVEEDVAMESSPRLSDTNASGGDSEPNKISEDVLKCLCSIFMRLCTSTEMSPKLELPPSLALPSFKTDRQLKFQDPYGSNLEFKERDIGPYKLLCVIEAGSIDFRRKKNALFLLHKLKLLLGKLASVNLEGLTDQHKLAFWINVYNSCMMNAFLENGIPQSPEAVVALMRDETLVVGGQSLNALTIEHFILRLPFYMQHIYPKPAKADDVKARGAFGLEWSEPLVSFALSCGSWSSPAVRVYTASQVESELIAAKRDYLQAAVGVLKNCNRLVIPKLLDWYLLDFAKDFESLVDWVCLQLPDDLRNNALNCLQRKGREDLSEIVQVMPFDFSFRYLLRP